MQTPVTPALMGPMDEFTATIHSLGEHIVDGIGRDELKHVLVSGDELTSSVEITIVLSHPSWSVQQRAVDKMVELRALFLDEISFDYRFAPAPEGQLTTTSTKAAQLEFA